MNTKYQYRLGSVLLLEAKLTKLATRRQDRQLMHTSPANDLLISASKAQECARQSGSRQIQSSLRLHILRPRHTACGYGG